MGNQFSRFKLQKQVTTRRQGGWKRRGETVITRLRIGHTGLNYNLSRLGKQATGICINCDKRETVEHIKTFSLASSHEVLEKRKETSLFDRI